MYDQLSDEQLSDFLSLALRDPRPIGETTDAWYLLQEYKRRHTKQGERQSK